MKKNLIHALYLVAYILAYGFWFLMSLLPLRVLYVVSDFLYLIVAHVVRYRHHCTTVVERRFFTTRLISGLRSL